MVVKEAVDGSLLAMCKTERQITPLLGLKHIADATRVLDMVRSVANGTGLPAAVDITTPGHDDQPATWSTEQFYLHARGGPLADIAELLKQHKFAGDVIATLNVDLVPALLGLTPCRVTVVHVCGVYVWCGGDCFMGSDGGVFLAWRPLAG